MAGNKLKVWFFSLSSELSHTVDACYDSKRSYCQFRNMFVSGQKTQRHTGTHCKMDLEVKLSQKLD